MVVFASFGVAAPNHQEFTFGRTPTGGMLLDLGSIDYVHISSSELKISSSISFPVPSLVLLAESSSVLLLFMPVRSFLWNKDGSTLTADDFLTS